MTREALLQAVREVLIDRLKLRIEPDQIQPDTPLFGTGLGMDSVDAVDLAVGIEERTGVKIPEDWHGRVALRTVNTLVAFLADPTVADRPSPAVDPALHALRTGVVLARHDHMGVLRVTGEDAFELLDAVVPRPLFLRDGQMLPTLLLNDDGTVYADVYVVADDLDYLLVVEGPAIPALITWLTPYLGSWKIELVDLTESHGVLGVHGPYAWELMGELVGPEVVGVGYLRTFSMYEVDALCLRAGKTGEFGYLILTPDPEPLWTELLATGVHFDAAVIDLHSLDHAALENGFFSIRRSPDLTPVELQLLWRIAWDRKAPGMDALRAHRDAPTRVNWCQNDSGVALVELPLEQAHPGHETDGLTTFSPPLLHNRSLFIDAQQHSYEGRDLDDFPAL